MLILSIFEIRMESKQFDMDWKGFASDPSPSDIAWFETKNWRELALQDEMMIEIRKKRMKGFIKKRKYFFDLRNKKLKITNVIKYYDFKYYFFY